MIPLFYFMLTSAEFSLSVYYTKTFLRNGFLPITFGIRKDRELTPFEGVVGCVPSLRVDRAHIVKDFTSKTGRFYTCLPMEIL